MQKYEAWPNVFVVFVPTHTFFLAENQARPPQNGAAFVIYI